MKQCVNCGKELIDAAQFCIYCGARQPGETSGAAVRKKHVLKRKGSAAEEGEDGQRGLPAEEWSDAPDGGKRTGSGKILSFIKEHKKISAVCAAVIAAAAVILGIVGSSSAVIDLAQYTEVEFSGYNGAGTARVVFHDNAFQYDVAKAMAGRGVISRAVMRDASPDTIQGILNSRWEDGSKVDLAASGFDYVLDKTQGLSNGDIVKLTYRCNNAKMKDLGIRFKGEDQEVAVSSLEDVGRFDAFACLDISITGPDGYGKATISKTANEELFTQLEYTIDKTQGLHNGDQVTVTVTSRNDGDDFSEFGRIYGEVPAETTKTIEVSGLTEYPVFDAFAGLSVSVEGVEPFGYIVLQNLDESNDIWYEADRYDNLSNGDEVTVRAVPGYTGEFNEDYAEIYGQVPEKDKIILQIQGLPSGQEEAAEETTDTAAVQTQEGETDEAG